MILPFGLFAPIFTMTPFSTSPGSISPYSPTEWAFHSSGSRILLVKFWRITLTRDHMGWEDHNAMGECRVSSSPQEEAYQSKEQSRNSSLFPPSLRKRGASGTIRTTKTEELRVVASVRFRNRAKVPGDRANLRTNIAFDGPVLNFEIVVTRTYTSETIAVSLSCRSVNLRGDVSRRSSNAVRRFRFTFSCRAKIASPLYFIYKYAAIPAYAFYTRDLKREISFRATRETRLTPTTSRDDLSWGVAITPCHIPLEITAFTRSRIGFPGSARPGINSARIAKNLRANQRAQPRPGCDREA